MRRCKLFLTTIFILFLMQGCSNQESAQGISYPIHLKGVSPDNWFIFGSVTNNRFKNGNVIALSVAGHMSRTGITKDNNFGIELKPNDTYAIFFVPVTTNYVDKEPALDFSKAAVLTYEEGSDIGTRETIRLPYKTQNKILDLGEIDINDKNAFATNNPSLTLDYDNDGLSDDIDLDDQNDGLSDIKQKERIESINICHVNNKDDMAEFTIALPQLLSHLAHGDFLGNCDQLKIKASQLKEKEKQNEENEENQKEDISFIYDLGENNNKNNYDQGSTEPIINANIIIEPSKDEDENQPQESEDISDEEPNDVPKKDENNASELDEIVRKR